jgi:predicted DNA-binding transcriptional regulator YafY
LCLKSRFWRDAPRRRSLLLKAESRLSSETVSALRPLRLGVRGLDDFMRHSFKGMHDELYTVKVRISPGWARWVGEKIWHESQKATKLPNGSLEITFRVAGLDEIERWVLSLGPECLVLEPEKLKDMVRKDLSKHLAQYSKSPVSINLLKEIRAI